MKAVRILLLFLALGMLLVGSLAADTDTVTMTWHAITGGGGTSSGGNLTLRGALGHWHTVYMSGGSYRLRPDFLGPRDRPVLPPPPPPPPPPPVGIRIYLPSVMRGR